MMIRAKQFVALLALMCLSLSAAWAQTANPTISFNSKDDGDVVMVPGDEQVCQAPLEISLEANIEDAVGWTPKVEWIVYDADKGSVEKPIITRFEPDSKYTLTNSGEYKVVLFITFVDSEGDELEYESELFTIKISESKLSCPDGFSPNGDDINDIFKITYQSIVKMEGAFFNRWGQKVYGFDLSNVDQGWDGRHNGSVVNDGVYFLKLHAIGSDGLKYDIRKAVNVLTKYRENE